MKKIYALAFFLQIFSLRGAMPVAKEAKEVAVKLPSEKVLNERLSSLTGGAVDFVIENHIPDILADKTFTVATLKALLQSNIVEYSQKMRHVSNIELMTSSNLLPIMQCILQEHPLLIAALEKEN